MVQEKHAKFVLNYGWLKKITFWIGLWRNGAKNILGKSKGREFGGCTLTPGPLGGGPAFGGSRLGSWDEKARGIWSINPLSNQLLDFVVQWECYKKNPGFRGLPLTLRLPKSSTRSYLEGEKKCPCPADGELVSPKKLVTQAPIFLGQIRDLICDFDQCNQLSA